MMASVFFAFGFKNRTRDEIIAAIRQYFLIAVSISSRCAMNEV